MGIDRISKIKNHRIFRDFKWPSDLLDFKEKNLIYGWNGTGKTTLSNLFRATEKSLSINEGEIEFVISSKKIDGSSLDTSQNLPQVRVFNKDFIAENVFTSHGDVLPIFFLGEENIEKQKQVEILKIDLEEVEKRKQKKEGDKIQRVKELDDFKKNHAKSIKDLLSSSGGKNSYNNYDKRIFETKCNDLLNLSETDQKQKLSSQEKLNSLKNQIESLPKDSLPYIELTYPDTTILTDQINSLLEKTVVSNVINSLKNDQELSNWVETGLGKHKKENSPDCLFCGQTLPDSRLKELESHFNDEYNAFIEEIDALSASIQAAMDELQSFTPPEKHRFYEHLVDQFNNKSKEFLKDLDRVISYLKELQRILQEKRKKPFQEISKDLEVVSGNKEIINGLNEIINRHNSETENFHTVITNARLSIEESKVSDCIDEYNQKKNVIGNLADKIDGMLKIEKELKSKIRNNEKDIEERLKPAEELTKEIQDYLGTKELTIKIKRNGYQIIRNEDDKAENLSEGEKTAIAFLYFLKSLEDKSFDLKKGIVVIDDPVSSLDTNALFQAFGYVKDRTKDAEQLILLTHSHSFFRLVKNWFNHLPNQNKKDINLRPARFFMLINQTNDNLISSSIVKLDSLLHEYDSEYHYLFKIIYSAANSEEEHPLEYNYHLPNIARRLLESFLAFRQPSKTGQLRQQMELILFDEVKKTRIIRFLHIHSHGEQISGPEHDPSILLETKSVLNEMLRMIQKEDERHFKEMEKLVSMKISAQP